ncbi:zinc metallopeptidase [Candidatus Poribacteria bacterium]|nr:zinc metallopeptidase [Candidatus Poribacteria bacterium]
MFFDPVYFIFLAPALILGFIAQMAVKGRFKKYSQVAASSRVTGAEAAARMLQHAGLGGTVGIERAGGYLSDHYDPRQRVLRLSPDVHDGRSLAALGVACHEAGHAIQHARKYAPLALRNAIVPVAGFGSNMAWILIVIGIGLTAMHAALGQVVAIGGFLLYVVIFLFQLVNLPVEFDASSRARKMLPQLGLISGPQEAAAVGKVLNAAALTYVAATSAALMTVLYWAFRLGLLGGRRND